MKSIKEKIYELKTLTGWKIDEIAEKIGYSRTHLYKLMDENQYSLPPLKVEMIDKLIFENKTKSELMSYEECQMGLEFKIKELDARISKLEKFLQSFTK